MSAAKAVSSARKRRGVARGSITRLTTRLTDLEGRRPDDASVMTMAQQTLKSLENVDSDFKTHHLALIDLLEEEDDLEGEQHVLDEHDETVATLFTRISHVISSCTASTDPQPRRVLSKRLAHLRRSLASVGTEITRMEADPSDVCLVRQREEQLRELKLELNDASRTLLSLDLDDGDDLMTLQTELELMVFDDSLKLKRMLSALEKASASAEANRQGVKLPQIDVPVFNGNILHWKTFWEQFLVAVHSRSNLSDSEKLVYLRHSVKDGLAKSVIEGLSRSGDHYAEAVECLKARYDRPRLIHQAHVKKILDVPALKDGTGKELRYLHDTVQQHLRALKAMGYEPSGPFITSVLELKFDAGTMFEWQKHSNSSPDVPHYHELLEFVNLRAQASENSIPEKKTSSHEMRKNFKPVTAFPVNATPTTAESCVLCKTSSHPLFSCGKFKSLPHDKKIATVKANNLCINCLRSGHFLRQCKSLHRCRECQKPHHSLLHVDMKNDVTTVVPPQSSSTPVQSHTATGLKPSSLLMTCQILVTSPSGLSTKARALLDSASSASFISERLARLLHLPRSQHPTSISGIAGITCDSSSHFVTTFHTSSWNNPNKQFDVSAIVIPRVTCELPAHPVPLDACWKHLEGLQLADPDFGRPSSIDILLGVDVFVGALLQGRRAGPPGSPIALETKFGWVLAGGTEPHSLTTELVSHYVSLLSGDDLLRRFWEVEEAPPEGPILSAEEKAVMRHFETNHSRSTDGRFVVPLPKRTDVPSLGESRSQAVRRLLSMERSLHAKKQFTEFAAVMEEYFTLGHAEQVPIVDLQKPPQQVFYLPMHAVRKESSATTKTRVVFDASARSASGVSLNDILMVGPNIHPSLIDVLLRFRLHHVALTADVSKMYRAVELVEGDRDYHRFVWRRSQDEPLVDYRMKRVTFGVSASSFAANMSVKQNAIDFTAKYPHAVVAVDESLYVDDCLTGADTVEEAASLQSELQDLFGEAKFLLRKWNSSHPNALDHVPPELKESHFTQVIPEPTGYTKTLGIEWNSKEDVFRLAITDPPAADNLTKRLLTSDIAKTFDVLGWFSPSVIKAKILLQKIWERKVDWDEIVPQDLLEVWQRWRSELKLLSNKHLPRCHFPCGARRCSTQLHGFSDASEEAFAAVVYLRVVDPNGTIHVSLVMSKTRVAPLKRMTIPRLELCGAHLLSQILSHVREVLKLPDCEVYAWTDSMVVLGWLSGDPRKFKPYVGNRVTRIVEAVPSNKWRHVSGLDNPADCASRGLFPSELLQHHLWWNGPRWLELDPASWPQHLSSYPCDAPEEERQTCFASITQDHNPIDINHYSSFTRLKRVTAWMFRFIHNCRSGRSRTSGPLSVDELTATETYWLSIAQSHTFQTEIDALEKGKPMPNASCLRTLRPFIDSLGLLRVGGRLGNSNLAYTQRHPIILCGQHIVTKLVIRSEHIRLLHAGPTLVASSLGRRFHIIGHRKAIRTLTRACVTCRRMTVKPQPQLMGQLPLERVTPGMVFERVGVDYADPSTSSWDVSANQPL